MANLALVVHLYQNGFVYQMIKVVLVATCLRLVSTLNVRVLAFQLATMYDRTATNVLKHSRKRKLGLYLSMFRQESVPRQQGYSIK